MDSHNGFLEPATERTLARFLEGQMVEWNTPGASVVVLDPNDILYASGLGARALDPVEPVTPESLFRVSSVTKPFTGLAVLQLVERSNLDLEDDVCNYVPFLTDAPGGPITVSNLMTHTSGLHSEIVPHENEIADREDFIRRLNRRAEERVTNPDRFMYSNGGYVILGAIVAAVAERPFTEYVEGEILSPLGMERSTFDPGFLESEDNTMKGYIDSDGSLIPPNFDPNEKPAFREKLFGPFGLISTVTDLASFLQCVMNGGIHHDERLVSEAAIESMCSPQSPPWPTVDGCSINYGYGWRIEEMMDDKLVHHGGKLPGFHAWMGFLQEKEIGVALGFNKSELPKSEIGKGALAVACNEAPVEVVRWFGARKAIQTVTGTYESDRPGITGIVRPAGSKDLSFTSLMSNISIRINEWDLQFQATPGSRLKDGYSFYSNLGNGHRWRVDFLNTTAGMDMYWSRGARTLQFTKQ